MARIWPWPASASRRRCAKRVMLVFAAMALIFLFYHWFVPYKAEDQIRNYVAACICRYDPVLAHRRALGRLQHPERRQEPGDHTIVTKRWKKFEIVLDRFPGYSILLTAALAVIAGLSLIYVSAASPRRRLRKPEGPRAHLRPAQLSRTKGDSVGREWDYRSTSRGLSRASSTRRTSTRSGRSAISRGAPASAPPPSLRIHFRYFPAQSRSGGGRASIARSRHGPIGHP